MTEVRIFLLLFLYVGGSTSEFGSTAVPTASYSTILHKQVQALLQELNSISIDLEHRSQQIVNLSNLTEGPSVEGASLVSPLHGSFFYSCTDIYDAGLSKSGVYEITLFHGFRSIPLYCDMSTEGVFSNKRGWMTVQRRLTGQVNFDRGWADYVDGFGFPEAEHWIGLQNIYDLLRQSSVGRVDNIGKTLRLEVEDWDGNIAFVEYDGFELNSNDSDYEISNLGRNIGTLSNPLGYNLGRRFSTRDHDNEPTKSRKCRMTGGWWFGSCRDSNLNGRYSADGQLMTIETIFISSWKKVNPRNTGLRYVSMKLQ